MDEREADVCVVGAGYSGLTAAWRLHQAGRSVVVLEARDRIGGRVWTEQRPDGSWIDRGAAWCGPGQERVYALAREMGVATYSQYVLGENLFELHGALHRYRGLTPKGLGPFALLSFGLGFVRLDRMARRIPLAEPWTARNAQRLDALSFEAWLGRWWNVPSPTARALLRMTVEGLFACAAAEVSLLHVLFHVHSAGGLEFQTSIEGGAENDRVQGGMQAVLDRIATRLAGAVRLGAPVRTVAQDADGVTLTADGVRVRAARAIVAVPPWLSGVITYRPQLPSDRALLVQRAPAGYAVKIALVYDDAFWRADGLSGESVAVGSPVSLTIDGCGPTPPPGILQAFLAGPDAQRWGRLDAAARRGVVLDAMTRRFGPKAATPREYIEHCWADEVWTRGCFMSHYPPGVLTNFGPALRTAFGRVHWAGTETATRSNGFVDGAIRAGERAAEEVLAAGPSR
jgi:monoamine oxidase